jgi:hypothetical protein
MKARLRGDGAAQCDGELKVRRRCGGGEAGSSREGSNALATRRCEVG